jgi:hypothetical protein
LGGGRKGKKEASWIFFPIINADSNIEILLQIYFNKPIQPLEAKIRI